LAGLELLLKEDYHCDGYSRSLQLGNNGRKTILNNIDHVQELVSKNVGQWGEGPAEVKDAVELLIVDELFDNLFPVPLFV
jgi:hypothetical protein